MIFDKILYNITHDFYYPNIPWYIISFLVIWCKNGLRKRDSLKYVFNTSFGQIFCINTNALRPFYKHGLILISSWISNYIHYYHNGLFFGPSHCNWFEGHYVLSVFKGHALIWFDKGARAQARVPPAETTTGGLRQITAIWQIWYYFYNDGIWISIKCQWNVFLIVRLTIIWYWSLYWTNICQDQWHPMVSLSRSAFNTLFMMYGHKIILIKVVTDHHIYSCVCRTSFKPRLFFSMHESYSNATWILSEKYKFLHCGNITISCPILSSKTLPIWKLTLPALPFCTCMHRNPFNNLIQQSCLEKMQSLNTSPTFLRK